MNVEMKTIVVMSTAHLRRETRDQFLAQPPESFAVAPFAHGFFVYVGPSSELSDEDPQEIREVAVWLDKNFADDRWILFDCDAPIFEGLPFYEEG